MNGLINYLGEVRLEISKVVWPKRSEVAKLTLIVILVSAIFGTYIGGVDYLFTILLEVLVNI